MADALLALAFLCSFSGMGWFAVAMKPHWVQARGDSANGEPNSGRLRLLGTIALLASLAACLGADHPSMAFLVWVMTLSASALGVAMTLSYAPRALYWLTRVGRSRDTRRCA